MSFIDKIEDWGSVVFQKLIILLFLSIMTLLFWGVIEESKVENLIGVVIAKNPEDYGGSTFYVVAIENKKYGVISKNIQYEKYLKTNKGSRVLKRMLKEFFWKN